MQYTIESRPLTSEYTHCATHDDGAPKQTTIEAASADDAISEFLRQSASELVSLTKPRGRESIATVRKDDLVFLVRIYAA